MSFITESIKNIKTVGTVTRSSKFLCKKMVEQTDFEDAKVIVELGAGDGVITKHILKKLPKDASLMVFEVHPEFCVLLRKLEDPRLIIIEDTAEKIGEYLTKHNFTEIDAIISAIPFVVVPEDESYRIVEACKHYLKEMGTYVQVHYSLVKKKMYENVFGNVDVSFVPLNVPPAFVLKSHKMVG